MEAEEAYERLKEELVKKELQDTKTQQELQARVDVLENDKQNLVLKLARVSENLEKGDEGFREKVSVYEEMVQESRRAYI